ncbi:MAG: hypothetical protein CHKLHMKO_00482 [Candidatus Argoarchaeum ethanivorans]|uniref:Uncharacterized protein n=1 Tax=Candidatus Argoarchaeum ethanivorans TaxID=2608793 RepID=A0A811TCK2_9EURY|nr:MAG: hypothetical protein CHKLHMKO_00482 [Candidatus Argoarchaeum ethanivorans]
MTVLKKTIKKRFEISPKTNSRKPLKACGMEKTNRPSTGYSGDTAE